LSGQWRGTFCCTIIDKSYILRAVYTSTVADERSDDEDEEDDAKED
jgi:hypothetical protein